MQPEDQQDVQECLGARVGDAQPGDAGAIVVDDGVAGRAQDAVAGDGVVAESLDGQQPSVGGVADLPQGGQISQPFAQPKSLAWLMVVSVRSARPCLWYCLIWVCLYRTCRLGVTPSVTTRVAKVPGVWFLRPR